MRCSKKSGKVAASVTLPGSSFLKEGTILVRLSANENAPAEHCVHHSNHHNGPSTCDT
jgi:hypothetical protein